MFDIIDIYERSVTAEKVEEKKFDNRMLPTKLNELAKEYDITYKSDEIVPQDMDMVRSSMLIAKSKDEGKENENSIHQAVDSTVHLSSNQNLTKRTCRW